MPATLTAVPLALLVLHLGAERYAVPMADVAEVGRPIPATRLPGVPRWLVGAGNWRGRVLPVLDLRFELAVAATPWSGRARPPRLLVLQRDGLTVGLHTDGVQGLREVDAAAVEPPLDGATGLLAGQLVDRDGPVGVLDVDAILGLRAELPDAR